MENKRQFGECRCCLTKGNHRSLLKEYHVEGKRVVYKDYFLECFNVFLSTNSKLSTLICAACIRRLREAQSFRSLVLKTERRLLKAQGNVNETEFVNVVFQPSVDTEESQVDIKQETETSDYGNSPSMDYDGCDRESSLPPVWGEEGPRPLPTRDSLFSICPVYIGYLEALKGKLIKANAIQELINPALHKRVKGKQLVAISEKLAQAINASTLLENSNATVFKSKMRSGFPCFYCRDIFVNPTSLREHQTEHPKSHLFKLLTKYTKDALVVYADITDLKCSICNENIPSLNTLKIHLTDEHGKKLYENYSDRVIPFKLGDRGNNFVCQICGLSFETFGATDRHMNTHFSNYVCEECGSGFVTKHRLKVHTYLLHRHGGVIKCEQCGKVFASKYKYKIHNEYVHKKLKKMRCSQCTETFIDYFARQRHMEAKHGVELLSYKCTECDRAFNRKYSLKCHVKRVHLARRDVQCELCPFMCFNKSELRDHMFKHGGNKSFECTLCQKSFARKKTLTVHMRIHSDDKRYSCHRCGEGFVQNCSLKSHLKSHCTEYADL